MPHFTTIISFYFKEKRDVANLWLPLALDSSIRLPVPKPVQGLFGFTFLASQNQADFAEVVLVVVDAGLVKAALHLRTVRLANGWALEVDKGFFFNYSICAY